MFSHVLKSRIFNTTQVSLVRTNWIRMATIFHDNIVVRPPVSRIQATNVPLSIDKAKLSVDVKLHALEITMPRELPVYRKQFGDDLLQLHAVSNIVKPKNGNVLLLLRPGIESLESEVMSDGLREYLKQRQVKIMPYTLELGYDYWRADEVLGAILPENLLNEIPSGFTMTGHIAHMNLRDEYLPYKYLIGQLILDKNPKVKTVVNKLDSIDTVFRTFAMEVIAGPEDFNVEQHESDCRFRFDFSKVYWNSRLHTEHDRLISTFKPGQAVCDVFAGVGPFAVPAGKKNVIVMANDLNSYSYESMVENIRLNKVEKTVIPFNMDGREFIRQSLNQLTKFRSANPQIAVESKSRSRTSKDETGKRKVLVINVPETYSHYVMNLPDSAITFLDAFKGLFSTRKLAELPLVHVHCFHKSDADKPKPEDSEVFEALRTRISNALDFDIALNQLSFHFVRAVAPTKSMYCVSFRIPSEVAYSSL
ncbi:Met-10+ like-protein-domain-containing protein [Lipomyces arxii]|uniref:Met-10+ like-protein-domain-containing protein n=1 Tax=Lipomyces arxii TaxID=56418 RepID=UPI0034CFBCDA